MRRSSYMVLLAEHSVVLTRLLDLCQKSRWVADMIQHQPILLDELLAKHANCQMQDRETLTKRLKQKLIALPDPDDEARLNMVRHFKNAHVFHTVFHDLNDTVPTETVSAQLTVLAETILAQISEQVWQYLITKYSEPAGGRESFAIVGYGKFGGGELGYHSDVDLVFLYESHSEQEAQFFARLSQRIIHALTARSEAGILYQVDTRLRPSGASGLLVSHIDAFAEYQQEKAWPWEHQALVRARMIIGGETMRLKFSTIRQHIITQPRDSDKLLTAVLDMRAKMRRELDQSNRQQFDLKQGKGGIVDIEFMVQYLVLAHGHRYPVLAEGHNCFVLLSQMAGLNIITQAQSDMLCRAYDTYLSCGRELALQNLSPRVAVDRFALQRRAVEDFMASWR